MDARRVLPVLLILFGLVFSACSPFGLASGDTVTSQLKRDTAPNVPPTDVQELVAGNSAFAFDFYQTVCSEDGNLFYSPYSISLALAMTYAGARSQTEVQMADTLHFSLPQERLHPAFNALDLDLAQQPDQAPRVDEDRRFRLNIANSIWGQQDYTFQPGFLDRLAVNYGAGLRLADFVNAPEQTRQEINDWVSHQTEDRIRDLIPQGVLDSYTRLVLANAIYFKAAWEYPFEKNLTEDGPFTLLDGSQVNVPMMSHGESAYVPYGSGEGYQAVALPYEGGLAEMVILLPDEGQFGSFEACLTSERFNEILTGMQTRGALLTMPEFEFTRDLALADLLAGMGMPDAFNPDLADFSGMDGTRNLFISHVLHKAFVSVDEQGTEAAAATAVIMGLGAMPVSDMELRIDRPFLFVIRDIPTGTILFVGRVLNPADGQ